jgi:hypothetical protein
LTGLREREMYLSRVSIFEKAKKEHPFIAKLLNPDYKFYLDQIKIIIRPLFFAVNKRILTVHQNY